MTDQRAEVPALRSVTGEKPSVDVNDSVYNFVHMAETVRIDPVAHAALTSIARAKHVSLTDALSHAVELYRREVFLDGLAEDFATLRATDPTAWADELEERDAWSTTLGDGLS
jgi:hypothetical protein